MQPQRTKILQKFTNIMDDEKTAEIIENSIDDYYWGNGLKGTGKNIMGNLLMELRNSYT